MIARAALHAPCPKCGTPAGKYCGIDRIVCIERLFAEAAIKIPLSDRIVPPEPEWSPYPEAP